MTEALLTVEAVAERFHCGPAHVRHLIRTKALRASKPARRWLVPESAIEEFVATRSNTMPQRRRRSA